MEEEEEEEGELRGKSRNLMLNSEEMKRKRRRGGIKRFIRKSYGKRVWVEEIECKGKGGGWKLREQTMREEIRRRRRK